MYRRGVGILILNQDDLVWVGRRCFHDNNKHLSLWQMPQGGINPQEDPLDAAYRELYEETGIKSISLLGQGDSYIQYDFPAHCIQENGYVGQMQKWFAFRFQGLTSEICVDRTAYGYESEFDAWTWVSLWDTPNIVVDFKKEAYRQVVADFAYLIKSEPMG
ncbi:RNA pyrophosphohydrolase [Candidatus Liberibacter asiaticus]|uniref:Dinucleoside polyphosphate hydrolase n=2 Tax=Liberibacter asiaticus TaxID=34021 RepID=C6XF78_LIBAP|nr:RNA pyrophosphohydrolase [Candidatus Liberibacter asiaticus]ACT57030.1 dinucleoside polyphosphate hydrolase [Candidatus Liberibacter asiaticus str. psy62]AGH17004.1 dinucleoside polyphosphate hydrolase [Candidatus Liberibacter asiaticus str. gxpsy]ALK07337.1 RNA pyrophosphohydrolase [Candidatus Liberibacter asiaticus]ASK52829.1 RNA pyrophosphohydrolase [Candidatus Liberibacter asiaticus]AWL14145.1 RNA pyrophosphohydrolase [Candidatus Liberibacter asiaticus]